MIVEIKDYFERKIKEAVKDDNFLIFRSAQDESQYKCAPFASILTSGETDEKQFTNDRTANKLEKVTRKYNRKIAVNVALAGENEDIVDDWIDTLLAGLDSSIKIDGRNVSIDLKKISYSDSDSMIRDIYVAGALFECETGVYVTAEIPQLKNISLLIINHKEVPSG